MTSPPYQNPGDSWTDSPREAARKARKAVGLPASEEVGQLAKMMIALRAAVEKHIPSIPSVGITISHLVAFYEEDLRDACEYAKIDCLAFPMRYNILYETSSAYAGYGLGLCNDYTDKASCKKEQDDMDSEVVMSVLFTRTALTVSLSVVKSAYYLYEPESRYLLDFDLGFDSPLHHENPQDYWSAVESQLKKFMVENPYFKRPDKVLLTGDCIGDKDFQRTLDKALSSQMEEMPQILSENAEFAAAMGAAELSKRLPWDPYKR